MSGMTIERRATVGSCDITTLNRQFDPDPPNKLRLRKQSLVEFHLVNMGVNHDLKIAFLVKDHQDVESIEFPNNPNLRSQRDPPTAADAEDVFGSDRGVDKWVGWRVPYVGAWPPSLETKILLRKFHHKPKHVQLIPVMFAFAVDPGGHDYAQHFLPAVSTCMGSGHSMQIETRTIFIP